MFNVVGDLGGFFAKDEIGEDVDVKIDIELFNLFFFLGGFCQIFLKGFCREDMSDGIVFLDYGIF